MSLEMNNFKPFSMDVFPDEIWSEILQQMKVKDRKSYRIACRRLKTCSYRRSIQKIEKLHLPGVSHLQDIVSTLLVSERSVMNLQFSNQRLDGVDQPLWIECGAKIQQLELEECAITLSSLQKILTHCTNLSYLVVRNMHIVENKPYTQDSRRQLWSIYSNSAVSETLINLNRNKVIAGNVETLVFETKEIVTRKALLALISVFPNVKDFEFHCQHLALTTDEENGAYADLDYHLKPYLCRDFAKYLASSLLQLENLELKLQSDCKCHKFVQKTQFPRLKTAKFHTTRLPPDDLHENESPSYFFTIYSITKPYGSFYKNLISIDMSDTASIAQITQLLRSSKLREMKMKLSKIDDSDDLFELFEALSKSKLHSITIDNRLDTGSSIIFQAGWILFFPSNTTIKELQLSTQQREDSCIPALMQSFSGLTHLKLEIRSTVSNFVQIFDNRNLKCIELVSGKKRLLPYPPCTLQVLYVRSNGYIESLEYFSTEISILKLLLVQDPTIFFPNLRFLHIKSHGGLSPRPRWAHFDDRKVKTISLLPWELKCFPLNNLEGVYLDVGCRVDDIFTFFSDSKNFTRIRYIGIRVGRIKDFEKYKKWYFESWFQPWFDHCPHLTTIFFKTDMEDGFCLFLDPVQRKVRKFFRQSTDRGCTNRTEEYEYEKEHPEIRMFRYFHDLKSFYDLWKSTSS